MIETPKNEIRTLSSIVIVAAIAMSTAVLSIFTLYFGWDKWTIPVFFVAAVSCFIMHVIEAPSEKSRIHICCAVWFTQIYYYVFNTQSLYEGLFAVMIALAVLGMTGERRLIWICILTVFAGTFSRIGFAFLEDPSYLRQEELLVAVMHFILIFFVGVVADRTLKKNEEDRERLRERIRQLEQENKTADDFLANVSHEIRTPVNVVIGLSEVSLEEEKEPSIRANLAAVSQAGRRVAEQISDILDYSEIEMNRVVVNPEDYSPAAFFADMEEELRPFMKPELELVLDIDPLLPTVMRSDPVKLRRILWHLIMNGIKYTKEGGVYVGVGFTRQAYGINLCIEVKDTGPGMSMGEVERIYDRFYQSNSGRTRSSGGLGLGMSIVAGIVEALEGFITVDSRLGEGTRVHVCIPQEVVVPAPCMSVEPSEKRLIGTLLDFEKFPDPSVREYYTTMLKNLITGLKLSVIRFNGLEELKRTAEKTGLTHLFVGQQEYLAAREYLEELAKKTLLVLVCGADFVPAPGSRARLIRKPLHGFDVITLLDPVGVPQEEGERHMCCSGVRALAVDDEPMNLMVVRKLLGRYGIETVTADSGQEALRMCQETDFDLIFMDHMMPGMDGVETARRIRAAGVSKGVQPVIVALTANAASTARAMFIAEGFDGFIRKPIERTELERVLTKTLPPGRITWINAEKAAGAEGNAVRQESGNAAAGQTEKKEQGDKTEGPAAEKESENAAVSSAEKKARGDKTEAPDAEKVSENASAGQAEKKEQAEKKTREDNAGKPDNGEAFLEELRAAGLDTDMGLEYCMDMEFYRAVLMEFAGEAEAGKTALEGFFAAEDWENFRIRIHGLKSTAKTVGAKELSEKARILEGAAKAGQTDFIRTNFPALLPEYISLAARIESCLGIGKLC